MKLTLFKKAASSSKKVFKPNFGHEDRIKRDWWIMVATFALLIVVVVGFDIYLFMGINQGDFFTTSDQVQDSGTALTKKVLLDTQTFFDARQKEYDALKANPPTEIDPSI